MTETTLSPPKRPNRRQSQQKLERWLGIIALFSLILAWFIGYRYDNAQIEPFLAEALPESQRFEQLTTHTYAAYATEQNDSLIGYISTGEAHGYGGPMKVAVAVNLDGDIIGLSVIQHRETPSWYEKVMKSGFGETLLGKSYQDAFQLGEDIDGVTSATYTSRAIAESVLAGSRAIAENQLGFSVPPTEKPQLVFGVPEITIIVLFAVGYFAHQHKFKYTQQARWITMLIGLLILGFTYNKPLTVSMINQALLGFWPQWQTNLYWYMLLGGILFVFTVDNKNPYCSWFCPFGAAQECMGAVGGAKLYSPGRFRGFLKWLLRIVVWFVILIALLFRSPGITSYEIFGTLFSLLGSNIQFILLAAVLIASLFIKRPWCAYLCPLGPVDEFIRMVRKWILEKWRNLKPRKAKEELN